MSTAQPKDRGLSSATDGAARAPDRIELVLDATLAFADGTVPSEVVLVLEPAGSRPWTLSQRIGVSDGGAFEATFELSPVFESTTVRATIWWAPPDVEVPAFEDELFDARVAPRRVVRTLDVVGGRSSLGRLVLEPPPTIGRIDLRTPEPVRIAIDPRRNALRQPLGLAYQGVHETDVELRTWSEEPTWWLAASTAAGTQVVVSPLVRGATVLLEVPASGSAAGSIDAAFDADGGVVVAVPWDAGIDLDDVPPSAATTLVRSLLDEGPSAAVGGGVYELAGLAPGRYLLVVLGPDHRVRAHADVHVPAGGRATYDFRSPG